MMREKRTNRVKMMARETTGLPVKKLKGRLRWDRSSTVQRSSDLFTEIEESE